MCFPSDVSGNDQTELFARARAGDQAAWEELFNTCYPKVIRVVRRKLNPPMRSLYDSTDFASDVMKSLAAKFDRFDFPSIESLMAFLCQVAERKVIDEYRKQRTGKRDRTKERPIDAHDASTDDPVEALCWDGPTPSQVVQGSDVLERIQAGLTASEKKVIELKQLGYSNAEIAELTGVNIRKVQRFLKDLEESLQQSGDPR